MKKIFILLLFILGYGELHSQFDHGGIVEPPRQVQPIRKYFQIKDTLFLCNIDKKNFPDTIINIYKLAVRISKNQWETPLDSEGSYSVMKLKKIRPSKWFRKNNHNFLNAVECKPKYEIKYNSDGSIIKWIFLGNLVFRKDRNVPSGTVP